MEIGMDFQGENSLWRGATYNNVNGGCVVSWPKQSDKKKFFKKTTAEEIFIRELEILLPMLSNQIIPMDSLKMLLGVGGLPVFQKTMVPLLSDQFPVKFLLISTHDGPEGVSSMLSLVSPEFLEKLWIWKCYPQTDVLDMNAMAALEQWKRLRTLNLPEFLIDDPTRVLHISDSRITVNVVLPEQASLMKETFRNSPEFVHCTIHCNTEITPETEKAISRTEIENNGGKRTYHFTTSTPGKVLQVECCPAFLIFTICDSATLGE